MHENRLGFKRTSHYIRQRYVSWKMLHKAIPITSRKISSAESEKIAVENSVDKPVDDGA